MTDRSAPGALVSVLGYAVAVDRGYARGTHLWVARLAPDRVRVGLDPLGVETTGTVAHVALEVVGSRLARGDALGTVEAEKFVGPLATPLSGVVVGTNDAVVADPMLLHADPLGEGWLAELEPSDLPSDWADLVDGEERLVPWFTAEVLRYRREGVLAE